MRSVEPEVFLVARPRLDYDQIAAYLREVGGESWLERLDRGDLDNAAQNLAEFAGKMCYRSWEPGLNPNVRRVRTEQDKYLENILSMAHGSVLEHVNFTFVLHNVSRVFTHELVRHRPGPQRPGGVPAEHPEAGPRIGAGARQLQLRAAQRQQGVFS